MAMDRDSRGHSVTSRMTDPSSPTRPARLPNRTLAAFAASCLPYAALGLPVYVTLPEFYSDHIGVDQAYVGLVFLLVRLADVVIDPILGMVIDRTSTRWGRYRLWMGLAAPVLMGAVFMLFMAQKGASATHLTLWLVVMYAGYSISLLSQMSWAAVLSPDYDERSRIYGWWQAANIVGVLAVIAIPPVVINGGYGDYVDAVRMQGWFIIAALPLMLAVTFLFTPEPKSALPPAHASLKAYADLFRIKAARRLLASDLMLGAARGTVGVLFFYFFEQVRGFDRGETTILLPAYFIAGLVGAPIWAWLGQRLGKHTALALASVYFAISLTITGLIPGGSLWLSMAAIVMTGLAFGAADLLLRAMMADVSDQVRLESGQDRTGLLFSILNATSKIGYALSALTLTLLSSLGFVTEAEAEKAAVVGQTLTNAPGVILALQLTFFALPAVLLIASALVLRGYPLTQAAHAELRARLDARDGDAA